MSAGKEQYIPCDTSDALDYTVGAFADLCR
jgi:hypothetical protein